MLQESLIAGLTALQLMQLCQPGQIEQTMRLLFALNHWAKARERLFFADRQGLYLVKAALLRQTYTAGLVTAKAYVDGKEGFGEELSFDMAADIAAEGFLWRLADMAADPREDPEAIYEQIVYKLYIRLTGKTRIVASDVETLEASWVHQYILERLQELEQEARASGQPIPCAKLTELCIAPSDLLTIQDRRYYDLGNWDSWDQLDANDLRKLDPEGLSLIAFDYTSSVAHYVFHLPFRIAEAFVSPEQMALLKSRPWTSRESGEYYGRAVTEAESLQQPIADILRELGANITTICPRQLSDKHEATLARAARYVAWSFEEFEEDIEGEEDEQFADYWQKSVKAPASDRRPGTCPICHTLDETTSSIARVDHWRQEHSDQDLTVSQAAWLLNCTLQKEAFCQRYPPDYRTFHKHNYGTRYWKLETLSRWLNEVEQHAAGI